MPAGRAANVVLHVRYVLGHLATGFLVAVPGQLILRGRDVFLLHSIAYGIVFLLAFAILLPLSRFDWKHVSVPQFLGFERTVTFFASLIAGGFLAASFFNETLGGNRQVFWLVFLITVLTWAQKKVHCWFFDSGKPRVDDSVDTHAPTISDGDTTIRRRTQEN